MSITDASINRFLKLAKDNEEKQFEWEEDRLTAIEVYKQWTKEEPRHRACSDFVDWRSSGLMSTMINKLEHPQYIAGFKVNGDSAMFVSMLRVNLLNGVLYEWQSKTVAIDKMFEAQNNLKELAS